jgi:meso-butanediol dehydrogenase / (S,S)-butanediol dehydrogenase / diacetyl reductase
MSGRVDDRKIIVTGAGSGVGRAFALGLSREGATVGVLDLDGEQAEAVTAEITDAGGQAVSLTADVGDRDQVVRAFDAFVKAAGGLDVLFNNAGFNLPMHLPDVTEENWNAIMRVNAWGVLLGIQEGASRMLATAGRGKIINTASIAGRQGFPSFAPYCASKAAVISLTQAGARAYTGRGVTVNAFAPGVVDTPLWTTLDAALMEIGDSERPGQAMEEFSAGILAGRAASPEELVGTALYLASSDSDYMTGQVIMIDGGMVLV